MLQGKKFQKAPYVGHRSGNAGNRENDGIDEFHAYKMCSYQSDGLNTLFIPGCGA
jgi:hypothetical protein